MKSGRLRAAFFISGVIGEIWETPATSLFRVGVKRPTLSPKAREGWGTRFPKFVER